MKRNLRVHVLGASGSGTTTLGRALAARFTIPFIDGDDVFWEPTNPPFTTRRAPEPRAALLAERTRCDDWVFSGSAMDWADVLRTRFSHVIFLTMPREPRMERIRARERARYGDRIDPGGDMHGQSQVFLDWAAGYDDEAFTGRSRRLHERWLRDLPCPVFRLDGQLPTEEQVRRAEEFFGRRISVEVRDGSGHEADAFYERHGRSARARPGDVCFVASSGEGVVGCVRYCVEEGTPLLRSMLVAEEARKLGVGRMLLSAFDAHILRNGVNGIYCVAHAHLETFYGGIGFRQVAEGPEFLTARLEKYRSQGMNSILMRRE